MKAQHASARHKVTGAELFAAGFSPATPLPAPRGVYGAAADFEAFSLSIAGVNAFVFGQPWLDHDLLAPEFDGSAVGKLSQALKAVGRRTMDSSMNRLR
jgi:hypothetical protein